MKLAWIGLAVGGWAAISTAHAAETMPHRVLWGALTRPWTLNYVVSELNRALAPGLKTEVLDIPMDTTPNPFFVQPDDFDAGRYLEWPSEGQGPVPEISPADASWFDGLVAQDRMPDIFVIGGHDVISEGWHDDAEKHFIFWPTLLDTVQRYPNAGRVMGNIKLAILWGCNTMTNLEPHGPHGEYLPPEEIRRIYESGPQGRAEMIGAAGKNNTLEFYKSRLARDYGPASPHYEYTRRASRERCTSPDRRNCPVTDLERIMPESGLYDGTHRYNHPYIMKRLFPSAYLVLGYSSASPNEEQRIGIFETAVHRATARLNAGLAASDPRFVHDLIAELSSAETRDEDRKRLIEALRFAWTASTESALGLPSGSITPAYPELDAHGIFNNPVSKEAPLVAPYEAR
jgi:hypothetical protein